MKYKITPELVEAALRCPMVRIAGCVHDKEMLAHPRVVEEAARRWVESQTLFPLHEGRDNRKERDGVQD